MNIFRLESFFPSSLSGSVNEMQKNAEREKSLLQFFFAMTHE